MNRSTRRFLRALIPAPLRSAARATLLIISGLRLGFSARNGLTVEEAFALLETTPYFGAQQKRTEIIGALHRFALDRPRRILEIGAAGGGTNFLLSRIAAPGSTVVSIDINLSASLQLAMRAWARPGQHV